MAITEEQRQALEARRGGVAPAPAMSSGPLMEIPVEDAQAFGVSTTPVIATPTNTVTNPPTNTVTDLPTTAIKVPAITAVTDTSVTTEPVATVDPVPGGKRTDALNTIKAVLKTYGLEGLAKKLYDTYLRGEVDINNSDAIIYSLREEDIYKTRFAGNKKRADNKLMELDPASYIALEDQYRRLLQSNGLPLDFYDRPDDFTALIEGDVSPQELQDRVQNGFKAVNQADAEVKRQMQRLYGVSEAGLAAYFLDPERAAPLLVRQAEAAKISARAKDFGNVDLTALTAEELAARGITQAEAEAGFTKLGLQKGLYNEMAGEQSLTEQQKVGAALGVDLSAQQILEQRKSSRLAGLKGGGSFTKTTGQTSGTTESGLNVAQ